MEQGAGGAAAECGGRGMGGPAGSWLLLPTPLCGQIPWEERDGGENLRGLTGGEGLWGRYSRCPGVAPP